MVMSGVVVMRRFWAMCLMPGVFTFTYFYYDCWRRMMVRMVFHDGYYNFEAGISCNIYG